MPKIVTNIKLDKHSSRYAAFGEYDGKHYHIWLTSALEPESVVIYQNPINQTDNRHRTRRLLQSKGIGKIVAKALLEAVPALLPACHAEADAKSAEELAKNLAAAAIYHAKVAGPELLASLKQAVEALRSGDPTARMNALRDCPLVIAKGEGVGP
jgi:hypothetical protein